jgi:hypothetical protein
MSFGLTQTVLPANAYSYNRVAAVAYAKTYSSNTGFARNPSYANLGSTDCTNFASQVMFAGGMPQVSAGATSNQWWYGNSNAGAFSASWTHVSDVYNFLVNSGRVSSFIYPSMDAKYSGATGGDLYLYDWGQGEGYSHAAVSTNSGSFANYYDPTFGKAYSSVTGGSGDRIAQHSTDRVDSPWNWGYWNESHPDIKSKMRTKVIHLQ